MNHQGLHFDLGLLLLRLGPLNFGLLYFGLARRPCLDTPTVGIPQDVILAHILRNGHS